MMMMVGVSFGDWASPHLHFHLLVLVVVVATVLDGDDGGHGGGDGGDAEEEDFVPDRCQSSGKGDN